MSTDLSWSDFLHWNLSRLLLCHAASTTVTFVGAPMHNAYDTATKSRSQTSQYQQCFRLLISQYLVSLNLAI